MVIHMLKAEHGDCFLISFENSVGNKMNILVDGGVRKTYKEELKGILSDIVNREEQLDIIIVTHIDNDHIGGIISLFEDKDFVKTLKPKEIIYNFYSPEIEYNTKDTYVSYTQGDHLSKLLKEYNVQETCKIKISKAKSGTIFKFDNMELYILSPLPSDINALNEDWKKNTNQITSYKDDYKDSIENWNNFEETYTPSLTNKSSISFIMKLKSKLVLMMGDAPPDIIYNQLIQYKNYIGHPLDAPLQFSAVKLSHHGGENSINKKLLSSIICNDFMISTNGKIYKHPRKKTMIQILKDNPKARFYLNYQRNVFTKDEINYFKIAYYEERGSLSI